ncbi:MAG: hypothetical protein ABIT83_13280 [Massilia sp.]
MPVYVQHEVLGKVPDVFNAEAIWQAPGLALFARRPLLRDLLERSPREHRGRAATRCFSHVTLMLPQEEVDDDRHLTRGARVRDLADSLKALHQKDFGDLLGSDEVRYDVVGADALAPGQIEVKFGHAVYLPAADEKILYTVSTSRDSAIWQPVCPIYPNQRLALIGQDGDTASHAAPAWPFGAEGAILLINDGPDAPIEVQVRPKDAFDCSFDAAEGYYTIRQKRVTGADAARLLMKVTRVAAPAAPGAKPALAPVPAPAQAALKPAAVWKSRLPSPGEAEQTAVPLSHRPAAQGFEADATFAPLARQRVSLVALALPRLSRYRDTGASALEFGFDHTLGMAAEGATPVISFAVDASDQLHAITGAGRQPISAPASFTPVDGGTVKLLGVAHEMAERYCALLRLPHSVSVAVAGGARLVFGRGAPMLAQLRVLDAPRHLRLAGAADGASADRIGLSRKAFSFELGAAGYRIGRLSETQALYHLDAELGFVAAITGDDYLLPPGHHLVAGHYVLRFDA